MGLSNYERLQGTFRAASALVDKANELRPICRETKYGDQHESLVRIVELVDGLWPELLRHVSHGGLWLLGSTVANPIIHDPVSCWEHAIVDGLEDVADELTASTRMMRLREAENKPRKDGRKNASPIFLLRSRRDPDELGLGVVLELYAHSEQLLYYTKRYDDEMLEKFAGVYALVARLQGECYALFSQFEIFKKAYLVFAISEHAYSGAYPYMSDAADAYLDSVGLPHYFDRMLQLPTAKLAATHIKLARAAIAVSRARERSGADSQAHVRSQTRLNRLRVLCCLELALVNADEYQLKPVVPLLQKHADEKAELLPLLADVTKLVDKLTVAARKRADKARDAEFGKKRKRTLDSYDDLYSYGPYKRYNLLGRGS